MFVKAKSHAIKAFINVKKEKNGAYESHIFTDYLDKRCGNKFMLQLAQ